MRYPSWDQKNPTGASLFDLSVQMAHPAESGEEPWFGHAVTPEMMKEIDQPLALAAPSLGKATSASLDGRIEITVPDGTCVRVGVDVGLVTLRRIMAALRR